MNKKIIFRTFLFISFALLTFNKTFAQMTVADFNRTFDLAESDMLYENYKAALKKWLVLHQYDTSNANIDFKIGYTYLMMKTEKSKATHYLEEAAKEVNPKYKEMDMKEKGAPDYAYYFLGKAYHLEGKIDKAIAAYKKYKEIAKLDKSTTKDVDRQLEMCMNAKEIMSHPVNLLVENLGDSINSKYPDYAPVVSADEETIIFTSRREGSTGEEMTEDNTYFEDIYISHKLDSGWSKAQQIGSNINTNGHEATINMSVDGQQVFIYKDDGGGDGNIYVSQLVGNLWTVPVKMPEGINSKHWETHAALSADGRTLFFVSDRPGGIGGRDIYSVKKLPDGKWSSPKNLGPSINTPYDEDAVYLHPDGQHMFFASQGHKSMGGFDIFSTMINEDGTYTTPENVGYPINTTDDDVFFVVSADGKRAYYSSAHEIGTNKKVDDKSHGEKDIFILNLVDQDVANVTIVKGVIRPGNDDDILNNVMIELADNSNDEPEQVETRVNSKSGKFLVILPQGKTYKLTYNLGKYGTFSDTIMVPPGSPYREVEKEFDLSQPDPTVVVSKFLVAVNDSASTLVNKPVEVTVLSNDYTKKGKILENTVTIIDKPKNGSVNVLPTGIIKYTPNKGFEGEDVFTYNFKNSQNKISNNASVKIKVTYIITQDVTASTNKNTSVTISELDKENCEMVYQADIKSIKIISAAVNGKVQIEKGTGKFIYTPNTDFVGTDVFTFEFSDIKKHRSQVTTIKIEVKDGTIIATNNNETNKSNSGNCASLDKEYIKYFKYNKKDIARKEKEFNEFIVSLAACLKEGKVSISIESSASEVPTKTYRTNENLAKIRAKEGKEQIVNGLKKVGGNVNNLTFGKPVTLVQGPKYRNDFMVKRVEYEKYQYTKISVK